MDRPESPSRPFFSVDPGNHRQGTEVHDLIEGYEARAHRRREIFALRRTQPTGHFLKLNISRAEIVHDRVTGDVILRVPFRDVTTLSPDHARELQLII